MLNIITGRTGSGKTRYIRELATEIAKDEKDKAVLITPEQFNFETERAMLELLGNEKINNVEFTSFSRLAEKLLSQYRKLDKRTADDGVRAVLMSRAIETLEDKLTIYSRYKKHPELISEILDFHREIKKCKISNEELEECSTHLKKATFSSKLSELSLIFSCYDALMTKRFNDNNLYLDMLADLLCEVDYFKDKIVFIDAFSGFSSQEYGVITEIVRQAEDVYVTFCCDTSKNNERYELFYNSAVEIKKLKAIANKIGVKIAPEKVLVSKKEYKKDELNFFEENFFANNSNVYEEKADAITIIPCRSKTDECSVVAAEIKRLVREENLRYRDIAVIVRNEDKYKKDLASAFRKYDIDCFHDNRQPVDNQPLIVFLKCLLDILTKGFETERVLRLLKTQLFGFSLEEIALIEDYCLMWKIRPSAWTGEWHDNPEGLGELVTDYSAMKLETLNTLREKIVAPISLLKRRVENGDGETISKEIFLFLQKNKIDENLKVFTQQLNANEEIDLALEQARIWKIVTEVLDGLYYAIGNETISIERYSELFSLFVVSKNIGVIPNGMDEVIIGSADRIRASAPKVVFLMGTNRGVFPADSSAGVLFNDIERCELIDNGMQIVSNLEYNSVSENFIAYHAATLATDKLYFTYSTMGGDSSALTESEMVTETKRMFPNCNVRNEYSKLDRIESRNSAFSVMAGESVNGSVLGETLKEYFNYNDGENELLKINRASNNQFAIKDADLAKEFFGKNMYMSASRIEKFYKCPFEYFCEYGLKAKPRREAQIDAALSGTLIHYVMEEFFFENGKDKIIKMSQDQIRENVETIVDGYIASEMGGYENKTKTFNRTVELIKKTSFSVLHRLVVEFQFCDFTPVDFELSINPDGQISPYEVKLADGGTVKIVGSVDRVDTFKTEENTFLRVVDYKTGGKDFVLGEVFYGLNMQMLIYLFAIWENGKEYYKNNIIPAGVLYFQAKNPKSTSAGISKDSEPDEAFKASLSELKMDGMVLNNMQVFNAMDSKYDGAMLPAKYDEKTGSLKGKVISLKSFERLKDRVNDSIREMAEELHKGHISALPVKDACTWCQYKDVCKREEDDPVNELEVLAFDDAISMLRSEDDGEKMD